MWISLDADSLESESPNEASAPTLVLVLSSSLFLVANLPPSPLVENIELLAQPSVPKVPAPASNLILISSNPSLATSPSPLALLLSGTVPPS